MSTLVADLTFGFTFPSCEPTTPPDFSFDPSLLEIPFNPGHARSSSHGSAYSAVSSAFESSPETVCTRMTTPSRASPPIRQHGPILLPKIRSQDQEIQSPPKRARTSPAPAARKPFRPSHSRSFTNPEPINFTFPMPAASQPEEQQTSSSLLCSPVSFAADAPRRASSCGVDNGAIEKFGFPTYRQLPSYMPATSQAPTTESYSMYTNTTFAPRAPSPLSLATTPDPTPSTDLVTYLTSPNPAPSLVRTVSFPIRDPHIKHFWWDVRQVRPWSTFTASSILSLPGASALLSCPVAAPLLPSPPATTRHPETESALHGIYSQFYLPKLNAALAVSSTRPLQLSAAPKSATSATNGDHLFTATAHGESSSAAAIFGGKPTARVVGLVRSFDRFNTGMRVEGNVKRVEYLRGLAALHHAMRDHSCRYGFILTEIELVIVRNGTDATPHFGYLEVTSVQLNAALSENDDGREDIPLTACLALWGLCMMAADEAAPGEAHWRAEIGAPAEGTRRKAMPRDSWMPQPQLAEKREAKRSRGWVLPEDPVGRKELGKRGVRYSAC